MRSFITGSRAYGEQAGLHGGKSDVDLVVLVTLKDLEMLRSMADGDDGDKLKDSDAGPTADGPRGSASLRFGKLNLIAVTDPVAFAVWQEGTKKLVRASTAGDVSVEVTRDLAIAFFDKLRRGRGLYDSMETVSDVARDLKRNKKATKKSKSALEYDDEDICF